MCIVVRHGLHKRVYVCMCVWCPHVYRLFICTRVCLSVCLYACLNVCMNVVCMHACVSVSLHVCMHACEDGRDSRKKRTKNQSSCPRFKVHRIDRKKERWGQRACACARIKAKERTHESARARKKEGLRAKKEGLRAKNEGLRAKKEGLRAKNYWFRLFGVHSKGVQTRGGKRERARARSKDTLIPSPHHTHTYL